MATWHSLTLQGEDTIKSTIKRIMTAFTPKFIGSGQPISMAIFSSSDNLNSDEVTLYFSPKAVSLAVQFGAAPCDSTFSNQKLALLVGNEKSINALFPDAE